MIKNESKKTILSEESIIADNFHNKLFGLLLNRHGKSLIIKTRFGIHTFFLKKPIDVLVLDNKNRVVSKKVKLSPNKIFIWNPVFSVVLELEEGTLDRTKTDVGDYISF